MTVGTFTVSHTTGLKAFVYKDINVMPKAEFQHEFVDQINACREVQ